MNPLGIGLRLVDETREHGSRPPRPAAVRTCRPSKTSSGSSTCIAPICRASSSSASPRSTTSCISSRTAAWPSSTTRCASDACRTCLNKPRLQREFERVVVADVPQQIEKQVHDVIDWMVASELRQWQAVNEHVAQAALGARRPRRRRHRRRSGFQYDRARLINTVGRAAQTVVQTYDKEREASAMADSMRERRGRRRAGAGRRSLAGRAGHGAGHDHGRRRDRHHRGRFARRARDVRDPVEARASQSAICGSASHEMRETLMTDLRAQFEREVERSVRGVLDAVAPYTRFVQRRARQADRAGAELAEIGAALGRIRAEIGRVAA